MKRTAAGVDSLLEWLTSQSGLSGLLLIGTMAILAPGQAVACEIEAADRQLKLAEVDIDGGNPERAAAAAGSALKLDPACTEALFVRGLALHRAGRTGEAKGLLVAYKDLRGSLSLDPRFGLTMGLVEATESPFDTASALRLAALALVGLELQIAEEQLDAIETAGPKGELHLRMLELQAQLLWAQNDRDAAERTWRQLFAEHPGAAVDSKLPPEQLAVMARAQEAVAAGSASKRVRRGGAGPAVPWVVLGGTGAGLAGAGVVIAGAEHSRGAGLLDSMTTPVGYLDNVDAYDGARRGEQFGAVLSGVGMAALIGGVLAVAVQQGEAKRLQKRQEARR